jgi:hypothetical protein
MSRVQLAARLLYKDALLPGGRLKQQGVRCRDLTESKLGGKKPKITLENMDMHTAHGSESVKESGAWRYPGGVIQRLPTFDADGATKHLFDPKDPTLGRRKIESNFLITLNTNRTIHGRSGAVVETARQAMKRTMEYLSEDCSMATYLKFGPKDKEYADDKYNEVIKAIEWQAAVETGDGGRLHAHIWMTVHHYSQVQINMPMMQYMFKHKYNEECAGGPDGIADMMIKPTSKPYIQVKLLPTTDWAIVMKQYIHKGMSASF